MRRPQARREKSADIGPPAVLMPPRPPEKNEGTSSTIARLIARDVRFSGLRGEEREGIVTLSGNVADMDHVLDLARQISRLAGVREVVVENIRLKPR